MILHIPFQMAPWVLVGDDSVAAALRPWSERTMNIAGGCWHPDAAYREVVAEARDVVSAAELIAHISPRRLEFLGTEAMLVPADAATMAGESVTGAAFFEAPATLRVEAGDLVMTFVDDRRDDLQLREAEPVAEDAGASVLRLGDNTVIRLTGMIQGLSRRALDATQMFGLGGASFAT